jgi:hypothetical protein
MKLSARPPVLAFAIAALLSACGGGSVAIGDFGGDDPFDLHPPRSSGRPASVTVDAATEPAFVGLYSATDVPVTSVLRFFPQDGDPETCRFRFIGLQQQQSRVERVMDGEIRYLPNTSELRTAFVVINTLEFRHDGTSGATVDRANNLVTFDDAVFRSTQGSNDTVTVTGSIPLRNEAKPAGC